MYMYIVNTLIIHTHVKIKDIYILLQVPWMVTPIEFLGIDAEITGSAYLPSKVVVSPLLSILSYENIITNSRR